MKNYIKIQFILEGRNYEANTSFQFICNDNSDKCYIWWDIIKHNI